MDIAEVEARDLPDPLPAELYVVDVRESDEWDGGHIEGAVHIPLMEIPPRVDEIPRDRQVLVVCAVGARSARATAFLQGQGVDAVNLAGGVSAWAQAGRSLVIG